ncbi:hypothetical protein [Halomonas cerina]|uniref:Uncharacterized protein n=1 Tax=Halomonas cerina TaxID=447424 RepID=A0A839VA13_9GAMM|nr:hypothetical protein [Halomonas cerina]MBB3189544.1 hypothetical protein [Halomonas cerina]
MRVVLAARCLARLLALAALLLTGPVAAAAATLVCTPDRPVVRPGESVVLRAWTDVPDVRPRFQWSVEAGRVDGIGNEVSWLLAGVRQSPIPYRAEVRLLAANRPTLDCQLRVFVAPPGYDPLAGMRGGREAGRALLPPGQKEAEGYGLYSYLLFGVPPNAATLERYEAAVAAHLRMIPHLATLDRYLEPKALNAVYLPVVTLPPESSTVTTAWTLEHYDYARARALISALPGTLRSGPYLVSTLQPLGRAASPPQHLLIQDLASVPPDLVELWVREFLNQAAQEQFWRQDTAAALALRMRTTIARLAIGLPEINTAFERLGMPDIPTTIAGLINWRTVDR